MDKNLINKNIIKILGLQSLDEQKKINLLEKMTKLLENRLLIRLMEMLDEKDQQELEKLDEKNLEGFVDFMADKFPNFEDILEDEVVKLKKELAHLEMN